MIDNHGEKNPNFKHGQRHKNKTTSTYNSWANMKQRCLNTSCPDYLDYGGRGIGICTDWLSFEAFYLAMGEKPEGYSLDRINNEGHYASDNCKWSTPTEQANNRRKRGKNK